MITSAAWSLSSIAPSLMASAKPADGGQRRPQVVRDRQEEVALPGPAVLQALRHVVDGAGQRGELGVVVARIGTRLSSSPEAMRPVTSMASTSGRAMRRLICQATRAATSSAAPPATMK